jgi:hypothetical protein
MIVEGIEIYDGSHLSDRFAYDHFKDKVTPIGNIITFRAPMEVDEKFMVDKEDLVNSDFIYSEDAINICYELPGQSLWGGVAFQRLYNSLIANILASYIKADIEVDGDDIMVHKEFEQGGVVQQKGKASVSIVKECNGAILGHTGINIVAGRKAPAFAFSTNLNDAEAQAFMMDCVKAFYETANSIFIATTKIIK